MLSKKNLHRIKFLHCVRKQSTIIHRNEEDYVNVHNVRSSVEAGGHITAEVVEVFLHRVQELHVRSVILMLSRIEEQNPSFAIPIRWQMINVWKVNGVRSRFICRMFFKSLYIENQSLYSSDDLYVHFLLIVQEPRPFLRLPIP